MNHLNLPTHNEIYYELQRSIFLKNILEPYFDFESVDSEIIIYEKQKDSRKKVSRERLIFFMHCKMPLILEKTHDEILSLNLNHHENNNKSDYLLINEIQKHYKIFYTIENIHKAIDNLKIIFENNEVEKNDIEIKNDTWSSDEFVDLLSEMNKTKFD